eukprot:1262900-Amphidinium_carterae.1
MSYNCATIGGGCLPVNLRCGSQCSQRPSCPMSICRHPCQTSGVEDCSVVVFGDVFTTDSRSAFNALCSRSLLRPLGVLGPVCKAWTAFTTPLQSTQ